MRGTVDKTGTLLKANYILNGTGRAGAKRMTVRATSQSARSNPLGVMYKEALIFSANMSNTKPPLINPTSAQPPRDECAATQG